MLESHESIIGTQSVHNRPAFVLTKRTFHFEILCQISFVVLKTNPKIAIISPLLVKRTANILPKCKDCKFTTADNLLHFLSHDDLQLHFPAFCPET